MLIQYIVFDQLFFTTVQSVPRKGFDPEGKSCWSAVWAKFAIQDDNSDGSPIKGLTCPGIEEDGLAVYSKVYRHEEELTYNEILIYPAHGTKL